MAGPDDALDKLRGIIDEFADFCTTKGRVSEADTRVKLVDRVLKEVCCWPEPAISREDRVEAGYMDYSLSVRQRVLVAVEAKREGIAFECPMNLPRRSLKLDGSLVTDPNVKEAIQQVRSYCDDGGIRYAIATNGYAWIVFRSVRDDMPWRQGRAKVYPSLEHISAHFTEFWNLLSYEAVCHGSLEAEFGSAPTSSRLMYRVLDRLFNADLPLRRNRLEYQLQPLMRHIFEDIAAQDDIDLLTACYVYSQSLTVVARDLDVVITDAVPRFLQEEGGEPIFQGPSHAGAFGEGVAEAVAARRGELYLLLGGIGSGKTTFLRRYQRVLAHDLLSQKGYWFHVDFLASPLDPTAMERFVWQSVLAEVRSRYSEEELELRTALKKVFADKIAALEQTALRRLKRHTEEYEEALSPHLSEWQADVSDYVPRLLKYAARTRGKAVVLFIDNVDQLDPGYQAQIFLMAQRVTRALASMTVVALREESYYAASIQQTFTAYTSRRFHIASPRFRTMIGERINYAISFLEKTPEQTRPTFYRLDSEDISEFLRIVQSSVFVWSKKIARFIEAVCFGNMRLALSMFATFLTSGVTDVDKMLRIYRRTGSYYVPFHEFLKSIMLGHRGYYKEDQSPILNVFNCSAEKNASHFTGLRILQLLLDHRGESSREGQGYVELSRLVGMMEDIFDNMKDVTFALDRLVRGQLTEVNTRSTETVLGASHIRVTSAGWYYLRYLVHDFPYLDLVLQDTPLDDAGLEKELRDAVYAVDNLADREDQKMERMAVRFDRAEKFIGYLAHQERAETERFGLDSVSGVLARPITSRIRNQFATQKLYIEQKLAEQRRRYAAEEMPDEADDSEGAVFGLKLHSDENGPDQ